MTYRAVKKGIDIDNFVDGISFNDEALCLIFIFLDSLSGEYDVATKLGKIDFHKIETKRKHLLPIKELVRIVDSI